MVRERLASYGEGTLRRIAHEFSPEAYASATGPGFHLKTSEVARRYVPFAFLRGPSLGEGARE